MAEVGLAVRTEVGGSMATIGVRTSRGMLKFVKASSSSAGEAVKVPEGKVFLKVGVGMSRGILKPATASSSSDGKAVKVPSSEDLVEYRRRNDGSASTSL